jgi:hypothetical protein
VVVVGWWVWKWYEGVDGSREERRSREEEKRK